MLQCLIKKELDNSTHFSWDTDLSVFWTVANRLEPRSGPTYVGPDLGASLFASSITLFF